MKPLNIVSYNIRHGAGMDNVMKLERTTTAITTMEPDLIALQEVDCRCRRSMSMDQAAKLGRRLDMEHAFGSAMKLEGGEYGLAVLSRYPILKRIRHKLPTGTEPRCALEVQVQLPDMKTPLSFVCIHMDWSQDAIRVTQVKALLAALNDRPHPVILAGDFNAGREEPSMKLLSEAGWTIMAKEEPGLTWPADKPAKDIDHFVTHGLNIEQILCTIIPDATSSDHRPIQANLPLIAKP